MLHPVCFDIPCSASIDIICWFEMNLFKACLPHYVDSAQIHQLCSQWWKTDRVSILHYIDRTVSCCDSVGFADWEGWGGHFEVTGINLIHC